VVGAAGAASAVTVLRNGDAKRIGAEMRNLAEERDG
jgi:hypothetical protein